MTWMLTPQLAYNTTSIFIEAPLKVCKALTQQAVDTCACNGEVGAGNKPENTLWMQLSFCLGD